MANSTDRFNRDVLRLLGLEGRHVVKIELTAEAGKLPVLKTEELVLGTGAVVAKSYKFDEEQP